MKKLYLIILLSSICALSPGQGQIYLFQSFGSGYWPPAGWTTLPPSSWTLSQTNYAGAQSPEARLQGFDYNGTVRIISSYLTLSDVDTAILSFRYFPEVIDKNAPVLGVATRNSSEPWNIAWQTTLKNSIEPREFEVLITDSNLGDPDFQFCFFISGDFNMLENFYLDNVKLYFPTEMDGKLDEILTPAHVEQPVPVVARVINLGNTQIDEVSVNWLTNEGILHDTLLTGLGLGLYDSYVFEFNRWWVSPFGDYVMKMWLGSVNGQEDPYHPNDTLTKLINYSLPPHPLRLPCLETFTGCWCQPCATWAESYDPWCEDHPYNVVIKYQVAPDEYETPGGHYHRLYYDLHAIPYTYCNGVLAANVDTNKLDTAYYPACLLHSDYIIKSSFTINSNIISITNNIFPYVSNNGASVQTVLIEKKTYNNVCGNGQTEFHQVEIEMFPSTGKGVPVSFCDHLPYTQTWTADLDTTHVEEPDDLLVAVFIQQDSTREILQSAYAVENGNFSLEDRLEMITLNGQPLKDFSPDVYTYEVDLPQSTVESPVVCGISLQDSALVVVTQAFELPGSAVIDVYPESLGSIKRYIVRFELMVNVDDPVSDPINIFPNPIAQNGKLFLSGAIKYNATLYSLNGVPVRYLEKNNNDYIDLQGIAPGCYILKLLDENKQLIIKKIIIL
jgi:hypothetical protein